MGTIGRVALDTIGRPVEVSADGRPENKPRGLTLDWSDVTAVSSDTVLDDETVVKNGDKYLRYGQVLTLKGAAEVQTYTWTGGPTGGSAILTIPADANGPQEVLPALAFNATDAQFAAALNATQRVGGNATVVRTGSGTAGAPYVYTVTYARELGDMPQMTATHTFTGGTTPTVTPATTTPGTGAGKFGPYDSAASDGRQTLARGQVYILNQTVLFSQLKSDFVEVLEGGLVWRARVIATTGSASLAAGPTFATLEPAMPRLRWVE